MVYLTMIISSIAGVLLVVAGSSKVGRENVSSTVEDYRVLPRPMIRPVALTLPYIELVLGSGLVLGVLFRVAAALAAALFLTFSLGILVNLRRGRDIDCGCRLKPRPISRHLLISDVVLAIGLVLSAGVNPPTVLATVLGSESKPPAYGWAVASSLVMLLFIAKLIEARSQLLRALRVAETRAAGYIS